MSAKRHAGTARSDAALYLVAALTYIGFGIYHKWLLNWLIGPLWLIAWLQIAPAVGRFFRRRARTGSARAVR